MEGPRPLDSPPLDTFSSKQVAWGSRLPVPSWLISLVLHAALMVLFAVALKSEPQGAVAESVIGGSIVLKNSDPSTEEYLSEEDVTEQAVTSTEQAIASPSEALESAPPVDPSSALPDRKPIIGPGPLAGGGALSATGMDSGPAKRTAISGGRTRTSVFGIEGEGSKFVYVFDRSGSMGGAGRNALRFAKLELLRSLESLDQIHQFQIIFYNERPEVFSLAGQPGRLVFGNEASKLQARNFVNGIVADGGTQHEDALMQALRMLPDVIFFLTDGADPELSAAQLARIRRANGGQASINVVEFGLGSAPSYNFLVRLARENGGQYRYVDISTLRASP